MTRSHITKIVIHGDGIRDVLRSDGVRRDIDRRTRAVAAAARATAPVDTGETKDSITADTRTGRNRNIGRVSVSSRDDAVRYMDLSWLVAALDAARD